MRGEPSGAILMNAIFLPHISPELVSFTVIGFDFSIRWYALAYILGFLVAWLWFTRLMRRPELWPEGKPPMDRDLPDRLLTWIILGVIAGGRFGYAIFYNPGHYLENPLAVLAIWQGGMSFHGGLAGLVVATWMFCRINRVPVASVADAVAISAMPGLFFGRIANFINNELWGTPSTLPWAVVVPAGDATVCPPDWTAICARHPSQIYEALLEGLFLCALLAWLAYRRGWLQRPGQIAGLFFATYGLVRLAVELVREPDIQFVTADNPAGFVLELGAGFGLTMGQALSLPMILLGALTIGLARRTNRWAS